MTHLCHRITVTPAFRESPNLAGTVLFDVMEVLAAPRVSHPCTLKAITVRDKANLKDDFTLYFFREEVSIGDADGVPDLSDANAAYLTGKAEFTDGEDDWTGWLDLGGVAVGLATGLNIPCQPTDGGVALYVGAVIAPEVGSLRWFDDYEPLLILYDIDLTFDLWIEENN